jgi:probable F420-dependent oxidoreductase
MKFGLTMFPADHAMAPDEFAKAAEERGFDAIAFPEHTHIPVSRKTPFPGGGELPEYYKRTHDPFIALTAAAMVTERVELWTGISLLAQRDPIVTAKVIASLDVLSKGRAVLGIGYGWNQDELENHGVAFRDRRAFVRESVLAMRELWTKDEASFEGEHVSFGPAWSWPKPAQPGGPPVVLGAAPGPKTFAHLAEFCDGWMPIAGMGSMTESLTSLRQALSEKGRSMDDFRLTVFGGKPDPERIEYQREQGVGQIFFWVPCDSPGDAMKALDGYAKFLEQLK